MTMVEERHWELWGHLARNKYADAPALSGVNYWTSEPSYEGDDHPEAHSEHPDDEAMAERIGRQVLRMNILDRRTLIAWYNAAPNLPLTATARAIRLGVPSSYLDNARLTWLKARVEEGIEGCFPMKTAA